ncbi:MAG: substrate-binding domain-containing protein [Bacteroidales bacterium]|nr:MAG: substrate-binding domain-containing protein [Bacteroidales bacterium]
MKKWYFILIINLVIFSDCNQDRLPDENRQVKNTNIKELEGTLRISGAYALDPLVTRWAEEFKKTHPKTVFEIRKAGTGRGLEDLISGEIELAMVSREFSDEEEEIGFWKIGVAKDGVVAITNAANPYLTNILSEGMTIADFTDIFTSEKGQQWGDILKIKNDDSIIVFTRSDISGAADLWARFLWKEQKDLRGKEVEGDENMIQAILDQPLGLGFCNSVFAYNKTTRKEISGIKVVPIDHNSNGIIEKNERFYDSLDLIQRAMWLGKYPCHLFRTLYFVSKEKPLNDLETEFLKWVLTDGQEQVGIEGYVKLRNSEIKMNLKMLNEE